MERGEHISKLRRILAVVVCIGLFCILLILIYSFQRGQAGADIILMILAFLAVPSYLLYKAAGARNSQKPERTPTKDHSPFYGYYQMV